MEKRVIVSEEKHTDIYYKLGEMHGDIKSCLAEAKKTNGRVTKLEEDVNNIKTKIAYYAGAAALAAFLIQTVISKFL